MQTNYTSIMLNLETKKPSNRYLVLVLLRNLLYPDFGGVNGAWLSSVASRKFASCELGVRWMRHEMLAAVGCRPPTDDLDF